MWNSKRQLLLLCAISIFSGFTFANSGDDVQPDNTKVNERDKFSKELTAQDQGNSKGDIEITQKIRQAIVSQKSFSTDAKNIKIITVNGMVTLKGPVKSASEKKQIEMLTNRIAGKSKIISQLEVIQK